jgi:hypothetical protein
MSRVPFNERIQYQSYKELGWQTQSIARKFKRKWETVQRWLDRDGEGWKDRKGRGRKRATTLREDKQLVSRYKTHWRKKSRGRRAIGKELASECSNMPPISGDTVYRRLAEAGGKMRTIKKRFPLIQRHRINRVSLPRSLKTKTSLNGSGPMKRRSKLAQESQRHSNFLEKISKKYRINIPRLKWRGLASVLMDLERLLSLMVPSTLKSIL